MPLSPDDFVSRVGQCLGKRLGDGRQRGHSDVERRATGEERVASRGETHNCLSELSAMWLLSSISAVSYPLRLLYFDGRSAVVQAGETGSCMYCTTELPGVVSITVATCTSRPLFWWGLNHYSVITSKSGSRTREQDSYLQTLCSCRLMRAP